MELIKVHAKEFGLEENKAQEIAAIYTPMVEMLTEMEKDFNKIVKMDISEEVVVEARKLRINISRVRINADKARKCAKEEYLRAGNAIQGAYNTLKYAVESKEEKLKAIEEHFEQLELDRIFELQQKRKKLILPFYENEYSISSDLGTMQLDVWENYLAGASANYKSKIEAEKKAEVDRIEKEKAESLERRRVIEENKRLKEESDERDRKDKIENEKRDKLEVERIKKQADENEKRDKILRLEQAKTAKLEAEAKDKMIAEEKQKKEVAALLQSELNKGDKDKVLDLINDLREIKIRYYFKSEVNQKIYSEVGVILDKIINHIGI